MIRFQHLMKVQLFLDHMEMNFGWWFLRNAGLSCTKATRELMEGKLIKHLEIWLEHLHLNILLKIRRICGIPSKNLTRKISLCVLEFLVRMKNKIKNLDLLLAMPTVYLQPIQLLVKDKKWTLFSLEILGVHSNGKVHGVTILMNGLKRLKKKLILYKMTMMELSGWLMMISSSTTVEYRFVSTKTNVNSIQKNTSLNNLDITLFKSILIRRERKPLLCHKKVNDATQKTWRFNTVIAEWFWLNKIQIIMNNGLEGRQVTKKEIHTWSVVHLIQELILCSFKWIGSKWNLQILILNLSLSIVMV